jgi:hypothetical protein
METREWNHVDSQLSEIRVELTWESQARGDAGHDGRDQVVKISIGWVRQFEGSHADIVESLVINTEGLIGVLDQLMHGESGIVWLNNGVGNLGGWDNRESCHHAIRELLTDLGDQKRTHASTSSTTERVGDLETLEAVASFGFTTNDIKNLINKLSTFGVMSLCPVVTSARLTEDEVVGAEKLAERTSSDSIHSTRLQVDEDGTRNVLVARSLNTLERTPFGYEFDIYFIEVDVHSLELKIRRAIVAGRKVSAM